MRKNLFLLAAAFSLVFGQATADAEKDYGFYYLGVRYDNTDNISLGVEVGQDNLAGSGACVRAAVTA